MSTSPRPPFLCSPTGSSTANQDQFPQASSRRVLPLPSGTFTLLPHVQLCDNVELPTGPWSAPDLELRWHAYAQSHRGLAQPLVTSTAGKTTLDPASSSALDDDDDDDDEEEAVDAVNQRNLGRARLDSRPATLSFDDEFLVPFFLSLPPPSRSSFQPPQPQSSHRPVPPVPMSSSRRSSAGSINGGRASHRPSFSRLTPLSPSENVAATAPMAVNEGDATNAVPFTLDPGHASLPELPQQQQQQPKVPAPPPIGFLRPEIVKALIEDNRKMVAIVSSKARLGWNPGKGPTAHFALLFSFPPSQPRIANPCGVSYLRFSFNPRFEVVVRLIRPAQVREGVLNLELQTRRPRQQVAPTTPRVWRIV